MFVVEDVSCILDNAHIKLWVVTTLLARMYAHPSPLIILALQVFDGPDASDPLVIYIRYSNHRVVSTIYLLEIYKDC